MNVAKTKMTTIPERILLCYSGSQSDHLLLHFSQLAGLSDPNRKNLDTFVIISFETSIAKMEIINDALKPYNLSCKFLSMSEMLFANPLGFNRLLDACKPSTTRSDLLRILQTVSLVKAAEMHKCSKVYSSDTCNKIAIDTIADTCAGRGISLPWKLSMRQRFLFPKQEVLVVRPLRDLVDMEIDHYIRLIVDKFPPANSLLNDTQPGKAETIYDLTNCFIGNLDRENPATVSTVVRTSTKIRTSVSDLETWSPCALCMAPLDTNSVSPLCYGCHSITEDIDTFETSLLASHSLELLSRFDR